MVNMREFSRYTRLYQKKMLGILRANGIQVPKESEENIVALRYYMEQEGILTMYPVLEKVLNIVNDCSASSTLKLSTMQECLGEAFKKAQPMEA